MSVKDSAVKRLDDRIGLEHVLIAGMIVVAAYMLLESFSFQREAYLFPRFTAIVTIVGACLLLVQNYLPERARLIVAGSIDVFGAEGDVEGLEEDLEEGSDGDDAERPARPMAPTRFLTVLLLGFAALSYLVGMLWTIPVFVVAYSYWFDITPKRTVVLAIVGFAIGLTFQLVLGIPIDTGFVHEAVGLA